MSLLDDFMMRATLAAIGVALVAGPIGCFVVWRRMAYFGDATAHAAILGVALALATELPITGAVAFVSVIFSIIVAMASERLVASDTLLGVLSHGALAVGLVAISLIPGVRIDIESFLFGDVLAVSRVDLAVIWGGAVALGAMLIWVWQSLLLATFSEDLARAEGIDPLRMRLVLLVMLAVLVAVALKIVGVLLITAMLIIPAATARLWVATPVQMAIAAAVIGGVSGYSGIQLSGTIDTPAGPSIVVMAIALFAASSAVRSVITSLVRQRDASGR
ncbi:MAG: metal ABC transporter permease [Pseudomonadota bacterium]